MPLLETSPSDLDDAVTKKLGSDSVGERMLLSPDWELLGCQFSVALSFFCCARQTDVGRVGNHIRLSDAMGGDGQLADDCMPRADHLPCSSVLSGQGHVS